MSVILYPASAALLLVLSLVPALLVCGTDETDTDETDTDAA